MPKQEEIREGLYTLRFAGRYGKSYKLGYPDVDEVLSYLHSQDVRIVKQPPRGDLTGCVLVAVEPLIGDK